MLTRLRDPLESNPKKNNTEIRVFHSSVDFFGSYTYFVIQFTIRL